MDIVKGYVPFFCIGAAVGVLAQNVFETILVILLITTAVYTWHWRD